MLNATALETAMHIESGGPTLASNIWRRNGAGANDEKWEEKIQKKAHKTFVFYSWVLMGHGADSQGRCSAQRLGVEELRRCRGA